MMHVGTIVSSPMLNTVVTLGRDALSLVWMELVMMTLAVALYLVFGGVPVAGRSKMDKTDKMSKMETEEAPRTPRESKRRTPPGTPRRRDAASLEEEALRLDGSNRVQVNCFLEQCGQHGQVQLLERQFDRFAVQGQVDIVACNTYLKALVRQGRVEAAKCFLQALPNGLEPNAVTYNELLHALVLQKDKPGCWAVVGEMQANGVAPSPVTCSILLKSLGAADAAGFDKAMDLVAATTMDEVLFSSVLEACVRLSQLWRLAPLLEQYAAHGGLDQLSAPTYGSLIKAYGKAGDVERVWALWTAMRSRKVRPTSVTLGCMVDALVKNKQPGEAYSLVKEVQQVDKALLNTVIYSTLLKGFTLSRQPEKVEQVYKEMVAEGICVNTIGFNTMIDCFAKAGDMPKCEALLADLERAGSPDVVTFSTLVKGYCMAGDLDRGFAVLRKMLATGRHMPDEILFNSLLDGCARQHRVDEALELVQMMHQHRVQPSNYTLSILVKLMGRAKRLADAFELVEQTCERFRFRANVHVYTCLLQACVQNRQLPRALALHDQLVAEGVAPDAKLYTALAKGCLQQQALRSLADVVRAGYGLGGGLAAAAQAPGLEAQILEDALAALARSPLSEELAVPLLADLKAAGVHAERSTYQSAVQTSVQRAGFHPTKTFTSYTRGRSGRGR